MTAPERSLAQRLAALERANEVRTKRGRLKRDLQAGRVRVDALLLDPPDYIETMKLYDVLLHLPWYGRVKVNRLLTRSRVSPIKTVGGLSARQRSEIVALLRGHDGGKGAGGAATGPPARQAPRRPAAAAPRRRPLHMTTRIIDGLHDTACGRVMPRSATTRDEAIVTCGNCRLQMRTNARPPAVAA